MKKLHNLVVVYMLINLMLVTLPMVAGSQQSEKRGESSLIDGAKKEGKIVFWNPDAAKDVEKVLARFREKYPFLKTEYWRASGDDVHEKLIAEARGKSV